MESKLSHYVTRQISETSGYPQLPQAPLSDLGKMQGPLGISAPSASLGACSSAGVAYQSPRECLLSAYV
jgi:hypothetical protein